MKHLKTFESLNHQELVDKFLQDYEYHTSKPWLKWDEDVKYRMSDYNFPEEFQYEFSRLYYLYSQSRNTGTRDQYNSGWKTGNKIENNRIKRNVKNYISTRIHKKLDDDIELCSKLQKMYDDKPNWSKPSSRFFGTILDVDIKYIWTVFYTILSKYDDVLSKYNL